MNLLSLFELALPLAQAADAAGEGLYTPSNLQILMRQLIAVCVFALVGVAVLAVSVWCMARVAPFSMQKEIEEDQNVALGIIVGSLILGISLIISAAIVG